MDTQSGLQKGTAMTKIIDKRNLSEQVFEVLKDRITEGEYSATDRLPSENALAKEFGVSRLTVRAAIARLCAIGYVEVRNGEGTFIKEVHASLKELYPDIADAVTLQNVNGFRRLVEPECIQLMIEKASEEDIHALRECNALFVSYFDTLEQFETEQKKQIVDLDYNFHLLICKLSGNPLYYMFYESAGDIIKEHMYVNLSTRWYFNRTDPRSEESRKIFVEGHSILLDAISSRDAAKARNIARLHADYTFTKGRS